MFLSRSSLLLRPYRILYLLYDFINHNGFELGLTGVSVSFDYMGNQYKFYTPESFTSFHDVHDAVSWLKTNEVFMKHKDDVYPLEALRMPREYENGDVGDFRHLFVGLAIIAKLHLRKPTIVPTDVISTIKILSDKIRIDKYREISLDMNLDEKVIRIVQSTMFQPLLTEDIRYACNYVNSKNVSANLEKIMENKYTIKLVIGENRGITSNDVKVYQKVNGNSKEIKLESKPK